MKTKEEIEQLAKQLCNIPIDLVIDEEERYYKNLQKYDGIILGYTQCQEDTAAKFTQLKEAINKHTWYDEDGFPQVNLYAIENLLVD